MPKATDTVEVNYHGWLDSGKVFDSSYKNGKNDFVSAQRCHQRAGPKGCNSLARRNDRAAIPLASAYGDRGSRDNSRSHVAFW